MSGGIAQLVAVGAQDAHLVGQPEVSFFRSNYKRHTNFAQTVERQVIQGNPSAGGMSTVRFERKGDRSEEHTLNSSHTVISYAVFCLIKKKKQNNILTLLLQLLNHPHYILHIPLPFPALL